MNLLNRKHLTERGRKEFITELTCVVIVAIINMILSHMHVYDRLILRDLDALVQNSRDSTFSGDIALVKIDQQDYKDIFGAQSPLRAEPLTKLIKSISDQGPRAIAIDLIVQDTDSPPAPNASHPIIWAVVGEPEEGERGAVKLPARVRERLPGPPQQSCSAIPMFTPDSGGVVREQREWVPVGTDLVPTLAAAIAHVHKFGNCLPDRKSTLEETPEEILRFTGSQHFFQSWHSRCFVASTPDATCRPISEIAGKVVILGGTYSQARDVYPTPLGPRDGLEILAHAAQTLIDENSLKELGPVGELLLDLFLGALGAVAIVLLHPALKLPISLLLPVLLATLITYYSFAEAGLFISSVGAFAGIPLGFMVNQVFELRHLKAENEDLKKKLTDGAGQDHGGKEDGGKEE